MVERSQNFMSFSPTINIYTSYMSLSPTCVGDKDMELVIIHVQISEKSREKWVSFVLI